MGMFQVFQARHFLRVLLASLAMLEEIAGGQVLR